MSKLSRFELSNLAKLKKMIAPTERRIAKIRQDTKVYLAKQQEEINNLEATIVKYKEMIDELESRNQDSTNDCQCENELTTTESGDDATFFIDAREYKNDGPVTVGYSQVQPLDDED